MKLDESVAKQALQSDSKIEVTEQKRLKSEREAGIPWKKWGPYLSERQWGTVREDYGGRAKAGISSPTIRLVRGHTDGAKTALPACAMANSGSASRWPCGTAADPILKERLFGLTNGEGNHGEDVKGSYYYVDGSPTHSYMKYLYKYPQKAIPTVIWWRPIDGRSKSEHASMNCSTPESSTTTGTSTSRWRCQGRPGRYSDPRHRSQPRAGAGGTSYIADDVVPQ